MPWVNPHPVMSTTSDYCRYVKALLTPYLGAVTVEGIYLGHATLFGDGQWPALVGR